MKLKSDRLLSAKQTHQHHGKRPARDNRPGTASDYISHLRRIVRRAARHGVQYLAIVLYGRVSSGKQGRNGNLDHQLPHVSRAVKRLERKYGVTLDIIGEPFGEED